jgi:hypothetical protein
VVYAGLSAEARSDIAYFFDFEYGDGRRPYAYAQEALEAIAAWQIAYHGRHPTLEIEAQNGSTHVIDSRGPGEPYRYLLTPEEVKLLSPMRIGGTS